MLFRSAFLKILLSPITYMIVIPANIKSTTIVTTSATNVIPPILYFFFLHFLSPPFLLCQFKDVPLANTLLFLVFTFQFTFIHIFYFFILARYIFIYSKVYNLAIARLHQLSVQSLCSLQLTECAIKVLIDLHCRLNTNILIITHYFKICQYMS